MFSCTVLPLSRGLKVISGYPYLTTNFVLIVTLPGPFTKGDSDADLVRIVRVLF